MEIVGKKCNFEIRHHEIRKRYALQTWWRCLSENSALLCVCLLKNYGIEAWNIGWMHKCWMNEKICRFEEPSMPRPVIFSCLVMTSLSFSFSAFIDIRLPHSEIPWLSIFHPAFEIHLWDVLRRRNHALFSQRLQWQQKKAISWNVCDSKF